RGRADRRELHQRSPEALAIDARGEGGSAGGRNGAHDGIAAVGEDSPGVIGSRRWHAAKCIGATSRSFGSSTLHRSKAYGQRVWKRQPGGGLIGLGTSPARMMRLRFAVGSGIGTAERSASV